MASVQLLDGALAGGASSAWVAVNASRLYTVQVNGTGAGTGGNLTVDISNDGTNPVTVSSTFSTVNYADANNKFQKLTDFPVAFMRVTNTTGSSITAKVFVVAS